MASSVPILHTLNDSNGGSGPGLTFWSDAIYCGRRAALNRELAAQGIHPSTDALMLGTVYHAFHEIAFKVHDGGYDTAAVEFVTEGGDSQIERVRSIAERLYRDHRISFPYGKEGKVLHCEEIVEVKEAPWLPVGMTFAIKPDRVVRVGVQHSLWLRQHRAINVPPGNYLWDYKTDGGYASAESWEKYRQDIRFPAYILAWNTLFPKQRVSGVLVDIAYKPTPKSPNRKSDFALILVEPREDDEAMVANMLELAWARYQEDPPRANPFACWSYNKPCSHLVAGRCRRF